MTQIPTSLGLNTLEQSQVARIAGTTITLGGLVSAAVILILALAASWLVTRALRRVRERADRTRQAVYLLERLTAYGIIVVGVMAAISAAGVNLSSLTVFAGALGIGGIPKVILFGQGLRTRGFFWLCVGALAVVMVICWFFTRSWAGLSCFAVREDETAASSMGVSPVRAKLTAFVLGTMMAGLSGALYAHYMKFISSDAFSFPFSVTLLSIVVAGGLGTFWGPLLGALILGVMPEVFRPLVDYRMFLYAAILLLMIRFMPGGILGGSTMLSIKNLAKRGKAAKGGC